MQVSLFLPPLAISHNNIAVEIDGVRQEATLSGEQRMIGYSSGPKPVLTVLASRGIPQEWKDDVRAANSNGVQFQRSELPLSQWNTHWLGYTSYDVVLLTSEEARSIPTNVLAALRQYMTVGGIVMVHDPQGGAASIPKSLKDPDRPEMESDGYPVGFGQVRPSPGSDTWPTTLWMDRIRSIAAPQNAEVRLQHEFRVPVRGLLTLVILFSIGIGPVNVWLLSRRNKKMWLWWNVPAVSLATCFLIFLYSLLSEGVTSDTQKTALTLLDERIHEASTLGFVSYYCPLTPTGGLHFSYDTEVIPLSETGMVDAWGRDESSTEKTIDWTADQHLDTGWAPSRVPVCFGIRKNERRRERLVFHHDSPGKLSVVNGLGTDITALHYQDRDGTLYRAAAIPSGQEAPLTKIASPDSTAKMSLREAYRNDWASMLVQMKGDPVKYLHKGHYLAVTKESVFVEDSLAGGAAKPSFGLVYGISAEDENGR